MSLQADIIAHCAHSPTGNLVKASTGGFPMSLYYVDGISVRSLWGYRDIRIDFDARVNIIVGPNASGKTTILNMLKHTLDADIVKLSEFEFDEIEVKLVSFDNSARRAIKVRAESDHFRFQIGKEVHKLPLVSFDEPVPRSWHRKLFMQTREVRELLEELVSIVWLPVSRRLPISDEEDDLARERHFRINYREASRLESVDESLRKLLDELRLYRLSLNSQLALRYNEFERRVLQMILYSKEHDQLQSLKLEMPTPQQKEQLVNTFGEAGLLDEQMRRRIDEHFEATSAVARELTHQVGLAESGSLDPKTFFVLPLIGRTRTLVEYSEQLEQDQEELFLPLTEYVRVVNTFLNGKSVSITDDGTLHLSSERTEHLTLETLSSGEKQILILLTQALLWKDRGVIYIADEPELSLHVSWQEKLLDSISSLGGTIQIIVATHSPDIVGQFGDKVIELSQG